MNSIHPRPVPDAAVAGDAKPGGARAIARANAPADSPIVAQAQAQAQARARARPGAPAPPMTSAPATAATGAGPGPHVYKEHDHRDREANGDQQADDDPAPRSPRALSPGPAPGDFQTRNPLPGLAVPLVSGPQRDVPHVQHGIDAISSSGISSNDTNNDASPRSGRRPPLGLLAEVHGLRVFAACARRSATLGDDCQRHHGTLLRGARRDLGTRLSRASARHSSVSCSCDSSGSGTWRYFLRCRHSGRLSR